MSSHQQPKRTYGRRAHKANHWQGLADTELWSRASPVKRVNSMFNIFSAEGDSRKGKKDTDKENAEQPVSPGLKRTPSISRLKNFLIPSSSPRKPLASKDANKAADVTNTQIVPESKPTKESEYRLPESEHVDFSDLLTCLDVISRDITAKPSPVRQSIIFEDEDEVPEIMEVSKVSYTHVSSPVVETAAPASSPVPTFIIPKRESSLMHLNSYLSQNAISLSDEAGKSDRSAASPFPTRPTTPVGISEHAGENRVPSPAKPLSDHVPVAESIAAPSTPNLAGLRVPKSAVAVPTRSSPLREVINSSDLEADEESTELQTQDSKENHSAAAEAVLKDVDPGLVELLQCCSSRRIIDFNEFIDSLKDTWHLEKLGEASYSEVFTIKNTSESNVLKVMPFGQLNGSQASVQDIANELKISKTLMKYDGFVKVVNAHVVQGRFSQTLLDLWDEYDAQKGSENDRPDYYEDEQYYCIIVLNNAGTDLEHFKVESWLEAATIFWRVALAIAVAEEQVRFEHRDLHWGNIVLDRPNEVEMMSNLSLDEVQAPNIKVTIIDYTLSRASCDGVLVSTAMDDPSLYTGRGDYQYDIYRFMRKLFTRLDSTASDEEVVDVNPRRRRTSRPTTQHDWTEYHAKTNVLWLHYLAERLLNHKHLKAPRVGRQSSRRGAGIEELSKTEVDAYQSLDSVFRSIDPRRKKKEVPEIENAHELVVWGKNERIMY